MNEVSKLKVDKATRENDLIPINQLFINWENNATRKTSKAVEALIEKYIDEFYTIKASSNNANKEEFNMLLHSSYDDLIEDIKHITLPNKYIGLMSWLINRAFMMTPGIQRNANYIQTTLNKNRAILLNVLYKLNPEMLLKCFKIDTLNGNDTPKVP